MYSIFLCLMVCLFTMQVNSQREPPQMIQDDEIYLAVSALKRSGKDPDFKSDPNVAWVTDKTFKDCIEKSPVVIVTYFVTFDQISYTMALHTLEAGKNLPKDSLCMVACNHWTDVCAHQNVSVYPTVKVYRSGKYATDYNGPLCSDALASAWRLYKHDAPIENPTSKVLDEITAGSFVDYRSADSAIIAYLDEKKDADKVETFKTVAKQFWGSKISVIVGKDLAASKGVTTPSLVVRRSKDKIRKTYAGDWHCPVELASWIVESSIPLFQEVTPTTLPPYLQTGKPIAIVFQDNTATPNVVVRNAAGEVGDSVKFGWMLVNDRDVDPHTAKSILNTLVKDATLPTLLVIDRASSKTYTMKNLPSASSADVVTWVRGIVSGDVMATGELLHNDWKPLVPPFDFMEKTGYRAKLAERDMMREKEQMDMMKKQGGDIPVTMEDGMKTSGKMHSEL